MTIQFTTLNTDAKMPSKGREGDACFDFYSTNYYTINPGQIVTIPIGVCHKLPSGCFGKIYERSGLAQKGIGVLGGVIDENYIGEIGVILINYGTETYFVGKGDRIAQYGIHKVEQVKWEEVVSLENTNRGNEGYGSSGK